MIKLFFKFIKWIKNLFKKSLKRSSEFTFSDYVFSYTRKMCYPVYNLHFGRRLLFHDGSEYPLEIMWKNFKTLPFTHLNYFFRLFQFNFVKLICSGLHYYHSRPRYGNYFKEMVHFCRSSFPKQSSKVLIMVDGSQTMLKNYPGTKVSLATVAIAFSHYLSNVYPCSKSYIATNTNDYYYTYRSFSNYPFQGDFGEASCANTEYFFGDSSIDTVELIKAFSNARLGEIYLTHTYDGTPVYSRYPVGLSFISSFDAIVIISPEIINHDAQSDGRLRFELSEELKLSSSVKIIRIGFGDIPSLCNDHDYYLANGSRLDEFDYIHDSISGNTYCNDSNFENINCNI